MPKQVRERESEREICHVSLEDIEDSVVLLGLCVNPPPPAQDEEAARSEANDMT